MKKIQKKTKAAKNNEKHRDMLKEADRMTVRAEKKQKLSLLAP